MCVHNMRVPTEIYFLIFSFLTRDADKIKYLSVCKKFNILKYDLVLNEFYEYSKISHCADKFNFSHILYDASVPYLHIPEYVPVIHNDVIQNLGIKNLKSFLVDKHSVKDHMIDTDIFNNRRDHHINYWYRLNDSMNINEQNDVFMLTGQFIKHDIIFWHINLCDKIFRMNYFFEKCVRIYSVVFGLIFFASVIITVMIVVFSVLFVVIGVLNYVNQNVDDMTHPVGLLLVLIWMVVLVRKLC